MPRHGKNLRAGTCWLIILLSANLAACGGGGNSVMGGGGNGGNLPISIVIATDSEFMEPGQPAEVTAIVSNDRAGRGVNWTVTCPEPSCGAFSDSSTASGKSTTYTAPADHLVGELTITITATSKSDPTVTASIALNVEGIQISIDFETDTLSAGTSEQITATVSHDSTGQGVNWTVTCETAPCGDVSPATTPSGDATTYTAPTTHPLGDLPVTLTATSITDAAASNFVMVTVTGVRVSIASDAGLVTAGTTAQFTATVTDDPADAGVAWTVNCNGGSDAATCGSVALATSQSGAAVVYTAPLTAPAGDLFVDIVATSVTLSSASSTYSITVPAITTSVTPISALLPLTIPQEFVATIENDPSSSGASWTLSQDDAPCSEDCGALLPSTTPDGAPTTYTAPGNMLTNALVQVNAASETDPSKLDAANVTITTGSVKLVPADLAMSRGALSRTAILTNTGSDALTISAIAITGRDPQQFSQTNTCGTSLAAGQSCDIVVQYDAHPTGRGFVHTALVNIVDSSTDSPQHLHVTGNAKQAGIPAMRAALANEATASVPRPTGSSLVGTRVMHLVDARRQDPYLATGARRELMVRFWYPAPADTHCVSAEYMAPEVAGYMAELLKISLPAVSTNSCLDAPVADGAHAVVVFTHGFTGTFTDYTYLFEDLASRGYVVASIDHTHEATAVEFPDGRLEKSVYGSYLTAYARSDVKALDYAVSVRLGDLTFVLNELQRLNGEGAFAAKIDLSRVALAGHSLGGLMTVLGVERESRVKAGVVLDGLVPVTAIASTRTPLLMIAAGRKQWSDNECRLWDELRGPRAAVNLEGAEHYALSDAVWLAKGAIGTGVAGPDETIAAIRDHVAAFLDSNLGRGPASALPEKSLPHYPAAVMTNSAQALCGG